MRKFGSVNCLVILLLIPAVPVAAIEVEVPFRLVDHLVIVDIQNEDGESVPFVFDTGTNAPMVVTPDLVERWDLPTQQVEHTA